MEKVIWEIRMVIWPLVEGIPIISFKKIKKKSIDSPKINSGITKGADEMKI